MHSSSAPIFGSCPVRILTENTSYPKISCGFCSVPPRKIQKSVSIRPQPVPSRSFQFHYSSLLLKATPHCLRQSQGPETNPHNIYIYIYTYITSSSPSARLARVYPNWGFDITVSCKQDHAVNHPPPAEGYFVSGFTPLEIRFLWLLLRPFQLE